MPLTTRVLSNIGAPLYSPNGTLLANKKIKFILVDSIGAVVDAFDVSTKERIAGTVLTTTDVNGIFSVNLWPNDRGDSITKYICQIVGLQDFASQVPSGGATLSWYDFKHNGTILTPAEITELNVHIGDAAKHLSPEQNILLDGVAQTVTSTEINHLDGVTSNIQAQFDALPQAPTKAPLLPHDPNGFLDRTQVSLLWDNNTRTLTVTPIGASFQFYSDMVLVTKTAPESIQIPNTEGSFFIVYNSSGVLTYYNTFDISIINQWAFVTSGYWGVADQVIVPDVIIELHGCNMDSQTHMYLHSTRGTAFGSGILPSAVTNGTGNLISDIQVSTTSGIIWDEDINHVIPVKLLADNIPVCYRLGITPTWHMNNTSSAIVRSTGTGRAAFNENVGGAWQLTEVTNGDYTLSHLYAIPGITTKYFILMGINKYTTATSARVGARSEITTVTNLPLAEYKLIATFVIQTSSTYTNIVKSRIQQTIAGEEDYVDWRYASTVSGIPSHY